MTSFCQFLAEECIRTYSRELSELIGSPELKVIDNSFLGGLVRRRLIRDGQYLTVPEAIYVERSVLKAFYDCLEDNITFPGQMRKEFSRGIYRLIARIGDPLDALVDRWGGRGGEPSIVESKIHPLGEGRENAEIELREFIKTLREGESLHRVFPTEAYLFNQVVPEIKEPLLIDSSVKSYACPRTSRYNGHYRRGLLNAVEKGNGFREIETRPFYSVRPASRHAAHDKDIIRLSAALTHRHRRVHLLTGDGDFRRLYSEIRDELPAGALTVVLDYNGKIEFIS